MPTTARNRLSTLTAVWVLVAAHGLATLSCNRARSDRPEKVAPPAARPAKGPANPAAKPAPAAPHAAGATGPSWSFDNAKGLPPGFVVKSGTWQLAAESTSPGGNRVLAQLAASAKPVFNVVLVDRERSPGADLELTVRLRAIRGRVDQGGGLVWRARDRRNYYIARYNPLEDNLRVYVVKGGRRKMIESATVRLDHRAWHTLRARMEGDRIQVSLDGKKHLDTRDTTFGDAGHVGLWTKADAVTHFDDLRIEAP